MVNILGVTLIEFLYFFMYYRVYTLKHCEINLLHSYINYYTNEIQYFHMVPDLFPKAIY